MTRLCALIVESGSTRGALAGTRALADAGWRVALGSPHRATLAAASRSADSWDQVPAVEAGVDAFIAATADVASRRGADLVMAVGDGETLALTLHQDRLPCPVPWGEYAQVRRAFDKLELTQLALQSGLAAPATAVATPAAVNAASYPVVVKSRFHWTPESHADVSRVEAELAHDHTQAMAAVAAMRSAGAEPLLQEVVDGPPLNAHCVVDAHGDMLAWVPQIGEDRYYPYPAGRRTRSRSIAPDPELAAGIERFLRELRWTGFAALSFLVGRDGVPRLIDFNGRVPASLEAGRAAGVNLLALGAAVTLGQPVRAPEVLPRTGARWQWLEGDVKRALQERRGGLVRDLGETLYSAAGAAHTIGSLRDPAPALHHYARLAKKRVRRVAGGPAR